MASEKPVRLSTQQIRIYSTLRFFNSLSTGQPELRGLMLTDPYAQNVFAAVQINPDDHVGGLVDDMTLLFDFEVDSVQKYC